MTASRDQGISKNLLRHLRSFAYNYFLHPLGVATLTAGTVYLLVLQSHKHAYLLLGTGAVCLLVGIVSGVIAQSKVRA